jgi:sugar lactone lactonase YvrE
MNKFLFFVANLCLFSAVALASEPQIWTVNSRADVLKGDARSVSVDANGTITLAPKLTEVFKTDQQYVWSSAIDNNGNVFLGTGGEGRIFKVTPNGSGTLFTDLNELNVTALAVRKDGGLFAASSPDGKVYQIDSAGKATVYFDPKEKYIWSLAIMSDGSLTVGTGDGGKLYRVRAANASPESSLMFDSSETHIISLATDQNGNLFAGTDTGGVVLKFGSDSKPFALLDSPLREIHELAVGPDGSVYALALGESASVAKPPETTASPSPESKTVAADKPGAATAETPAKSRYDLTNAKSAVYRITPDGGSEVLFASTTVTGFSLYAHKTGSGVLVGTSDKGRVYNISNSGRDSLALQTEASQISTILSSGSNLYATSSNQGKLYKIGPETIGEGVYESAVLDAKSTASWGNIWWRSTPGVAIETRSGNTETPNETWSGWSAVGQTGQRGKIASPNSRYLQWRAVLKSTTPNVALNEVSVAFLGRNIAPEVLSITILPPNVGLLANPAVQVDPNIELSGMDPATFGLPVQSVPPRKVYLRGARAFQWTAEDRNGDKLLYDVYYRETGDADFKLLKADLADNFYSLDGLSLADGRYFIRVVAKDTLGNPSGQFLTGEMLSEPFDIDNSQPVVTAVGTPQMSGNKARVSFSATDKFGWLARAEYSINGGEWQTVYADDGISDGPQETYSFDVAVPAPGEYTVTLRVFDAAGNVGNARSNSKK